MSENDQNMTWCQFNDRGGCGFSSKATKITKLKVKIEDLCNMAISDGKRGRKQGRLLKFFS